MTQRHLPIGIQANGIRHGHADPVPDIDERFAMVRRAGVFDYIDKTPAPEEVPAFLAASDRHGVPVRCGGWYYAVGRDEPLLHANLNIARVLGSTVHNVQILDRRADGRPVTDAEIVDFYERAVEAGERLGITICLEVHINMWSEDFRRVAPVGRLAEARGLPFRLTLDHSHVIFKIDHPEEQEVSGIREDVEAGRLILNPFRPGHVCAGWIEAGWVAHAHARSVIPCNPRNWACLDDDGRPGRGVQYPFVRPPPDQFDGPWHGDRLEPWKEVVRQLFRWHWRHPDSPLGQISTEFIPNPDYGGGCRYSLFEQSVACALWLRECWAAAAADPAAEPPARRLR